MYKPYDFVLGKAGYEIRQFIKRKILQPSRLWHLWLRHQYLADFPRDITILLHEATCVLRCRMCPQFNTQPAETTVMSFDTFKLSIDQIPDSRNITINISAYGETLMTKGWQEMLAYAVKTKPRLAKTLITSGVPLNEKAAISLLETPPDVVQISLDAGSNSTYGWLTGRRAYEAVTENTRRLIRMRKERKQQKPLVRVHVIEMEELVSEFESFITQWKEVADEARVLQMQNWGGLVENNEITPRWSPPEYRYPCVQPFYAVTVNSAGDVLKCCTHSQNSYQAGASVGNVHKQTLREVWESNFSEFRQKHLDGNLADEPLCQNCNVWALSPNVWREGEYKPVPFTGKRYPGRPLPFGQDGREWAGSE